MSEANEDNLLGDDLGEYDLLNEDEEALLADDYRDEQRDYEDVLDLGVTEDGLEDDLENDPCDGTILKEESFLEINASHSEVFDTSQIRSPRDSVNKIQDAESSHTQMEEEEDEEPEAESEARGRFKSERTSSAKPAPFRNIPDSLDKVVSNPLPAVRHPNNNQHRFQRGNWRNRGGRYGGLQGNRTGQPRMLNKNTRAFMHPRHPYMHNRFQHNGNFPPPHQIPTRPGIWFNQSDHQQQQQQQHSSMPMRPPLAPSHQQQQHQHPRHQHPQLPPPSQMPQQRLQRPPRPQHPTPIPQQQQQQRPVNNQTSRKILINPHFRGAVQPHPNARLVWDNANNINSLNNQGSQSGPSLMNIQQSPMETNNSMNHHQQYNQPSSQPSGMMYETQLHQQQQSTYPNYQGSISHHQQQDVHHFQGHNQFVHNQGPQSGPSHLQQQRMPPPVINSGIWTSKSTNDSNYLGPTSQVDQQTQQSHDHTNPSLYYNEGQGSDVCAPPVWSSQQQCTPLQPAGLYNESHPSNYHQHSAPRGQVWQYDDLTLFGPESDQIPVYDGYSSTEVIFPGSEMGVDPSLPVSSATIINEHRGPPPADLYPAQPQPPQEPQQQPRPLLNLRPPTVGYVNNGPVLQRPQAPGPRKINPGLNTHPPRTVIYQQKQPQLTEPLQLQQQLPPPPPQQKQQNLQLQRRPQQIRPQQQTQIAAPTNLNNQQRRVIQTKNIIRKAKNQLNLAQQQQQRLMNTPPIKRPINNEAVRPMLQKRVKMRLGDPHLLAKRKPDMSNLHEVQTVDTFPPSTQTPDTTTSAPDDEQYSSPTKNVYYEDKNKVEVEEEEEEDEEAREYRRKIEQQKKLREQFLQQKEARRKKAALEKQRQMNLLESSTTTTTTTTPLTTTAAMATSTTTSTDQDVQGNAIATIVNRNPVEPLGNPIGALNSLSTAASQNKSQRTVLTRAPLLKTPTKVTQAAATALNSPRPNRTVVLRGITNTINKSMGAGETSVQTRLIKKNINSITTTAANRTVISNVATSSVAPTSNKVAIENLAASTTEIQLRQICQTIGTVKELRMIPQERKALVTFATPALANNFFKRYQRKIIDLSLITLSMVN